MASKQYISIIRLFNFCGIVTGEDYIPSRAKKQLQAEFGISQEGFIEVDGFAYTRQDVFEEIERPDFEKRLVFHQQIWESPQLLELLELHSVNVFTIGEDFESFWNNAEFDDFFSPFFVTPFQYVSRVFLTEHKLREMGEWLKYEGFLQPAEREEALRPLRIFLDDNEKLLRNVNNENFKIIRPKIEHWFNSSWSSMFNELPHEFYDSKMNFVVLLINLSVAIQKKHLSDCRHLSDQLIDLKDIEENLRSTIISNHAVYSSDGRSFSLSGRGIWLILWLGLTLVRIITSENNSENDSYRNIDGANFMLPKDTSSINGINFSADTATARIPTKEKKIATKLDSILKKIDSSSY